MHTAVSGSCSAISATAAIWPELTSISRLIPPGTRKPGWRASDFAGTLLTYAEISPSGQGVKLFFHLASGDVRPFLRLLGVPDDQHGCKRPIDAASGDHGPAIEFYAERRFLPSLSIAGWRTRPSLH